MKRILITIMFSLMLISGYSQSLIVGNVVATDTKDALSGATVTLLHKKSTYTADGQGRFSIPLNKVDTLLISFIGYLSKKIGVDPMRQTAMMFIELEPNPSMLKEVTVFTGYQKLPKERATGSFVTIDKKLFNEQVGTTILERLSGIAGSISYERRTASPGFSIRGISTIQGPKDPLIVLDNFPYQGDLNNLNPNDVESITILKDAAAASIWGAKAGNGVIVITTKKGKFNQPLKIDFNTNVTIGQEPDLFGIKQISSADLIDVEQLLFDNGKYDITNDASARQPVTPLIALLRKKAAGTIDAEWADAEINAMKNLDVRNDFAKYFYQTSVNQQYSLGMNSGNEHLAWKANVGYDGNKNELDARYQRLNMNLQSILRPVKRLEVTANVFLTKSNSRNGRPAYGSVATAAGNIPTYSRFADNQGNAIPMAKGYSLEYLETAGGGKLMDWKYYPLQDYKHTTALSEMIDITADLNADYQITKNLTARVLYRYERQQLNGSNLNDPDSYFVRDLVNTFTQIDGSTGSVAYKVPPGGILDLSNIVKPSHNVRGQVNFDKAWVSHSLNVLAGAEYSEDKAVSNSYRTYGYDEEILTFGQVDFTNRYPQFATGSLAFIPGNSSMSAFINRYVSAYINAAYSYKQRYIVSLSARRDGSNLFGVLPNNKFNPLGSVGFAWDISRENFFKISFLEYLKLRATYGLSGNTDQNRTAFPTISYRGNSVFTLTPYALMSTFANPELKWEKVGMLNIGMDFRSKNNRISGSLEYYRKNADDLFGRGQIDYTGGAGESIIKNVAAMKGDGVDLELNSLNLNGLLKWTSHLNLSLYKDKIVRYYTPAVNGNDFVGKSIPIISGIIGKPVYSMLSYKSAGLDPLNGDPLGYLNGVVSKEYSKINSTGTGVADLVYHGSALPTIFGNFRNTFSYRNASLSIAITYKLGYYMRKESINYNSLFNSRMGHSDYANRWRHPGDEMFTSVPSMIYPGNSSRDVFYNNSEATVIKGDHVRLQYITLSYNFNSKKSKWFPFSSLNVYANANNLGLIWAANKAGVDPDYRETDIPATKNLALGIRAGF